MPRREKQFEELILQANINGAEAGGEEAYRRVDFEGAFHFEDEMAIAAWREEATKLSKKSLDRLRGSLDDVVSKALAEGKPIAEIRSDVLAIFDDMADWEGERIARTEIARGVAQGALSGYRKMNISMVEYIANAGACPDCSAMAGTIMEVEEASAVIPLHPNCYCYWVPRPDLTPHT